MRSIVEIAKGLGMTWRAGKSPVGAIIASAAILVICAVAVAVIRKYFPLSDYWQGITEVITVALAIIVGF